MRRVVGCLVALAVVGTVTGAPPAPQAELAKRAREVLNVHCHRCHGQDGAVEGGFNYVLDRDKLVGRKKVVPGQADASPLLKKVVSGKMPPADVQPRPSAEEVAILKKWIDAGAPGESPAVARAAVGEDEVFALIQADLDTLDRRTRRFARYFSLAELSNAGLGEDELQTYRNALAKLLNSLSWHPRMAAPKPIDPGRLVLRIDLRDLMWDANLWNRMLADYPYGRVPDSARARACLVATATRLPCVRADWFIATASRPPLYQDLLQLPTSAAELESQLRVNVAVNLQQERVARAGFNGSGVSRNNRVLERHDAVHGAYWRTYDFDAVPQNLVDRGLLLPDRRNVFAYPLGPTGSDNSFQHAGGEIIFNLPNGLHAYMLVNAVNLRIDRGPTAIVSDPRRPDRAVETGVSCMSCHYRGINPKDDQVRDHVGKNARAFSRTDADLVRALYPPVAKMRALMEEDAERYRLALEKTGNKVTAYEPVSTLTVRYEGDVDLATAAAELGLAAEVLRERIGASESATRNLGALKVPGGTVARPVLVQAFADVVRELKLGTPFDPARALQSLPDNTGETDPLEGQASEANSVAFTRDGRLALIAGRDRSVRVFDVAAGRDLRRLIGHAGSVWAVALSADGRQALSGSADGSVRVWDVEGGRELKRLDGHLGLVTAVALAPDGRQALSAGVDDAVILWDLETGSAVKTWEGKARFIQHVAFAPDGRRALVCAGNSIHLWELPGGGEVGRLEGHTRTVVQAAFSGDGRRVVSAGDDGTVRLWDAEARKELKVLAGHAGHVRSVDLSADGRQVLSGGSDATVRLWDLSSGKELKKFTAHPDAVVAATFLNGGGATLSASRDGAVRTWKLPRPEAAPPPKPARAPVTESPPVATGGEPGLAVLKPLAVLPADGLVGGLSLSPDGRWLHYLNLSKGRLVRVDTATRKTVRDVPLTAGTDLLVRSRDGRHLFAVAATAEHKARVQVIEPPGLKVVRTFEVPLEPYAAAAGEGELLFLSGAAGEWTDVVAVDTAKGQVAARWGGVWRRSFLGAAGDRVYVGTQGVSPGKVEALVVPREAGEKPVVYAAAAAPGGPTPAGDFTVSPDGRFLLCKSGAVVRLERLDDLKAVAAVEPFVVAAVAPEQGLVLTLTGDGRLARYGYPDFRPRGSWRLEGVGYQMAYDAAGGRLYVAAVDPVALASPRGGQAGKVYVYGLPRSQ